MTLDTARTLYAEAMADWTRARHAWDTAPTLKLRRQAGDALQYWGNRTASLGAFIQHEEAVRS